MRGVVVAKREGVVLRREGVVLRREGVVPKREGVVAKRGGVVVRREGVVLRREGVVPRRGGVAPKRGGVAPKQGGVALKRGGVVPRRGGVVVKREGVVAKRGGGGDYITIEETTAGTENDAAVYTVTVKTALPAGKMATFTNVATDEVVYGPPADADNTAAKQAAAIVAKLNGADGALYTAEQADTSVAVFTLTAETAGVIADAPAVAIAAYEAPADKTAVIAAALTAGDNAVKITGVTAANAFKDDDTVKAYIKNDGTELFITSGTAPSSSDYTDAQTFTGTGTAKLISGGTVAVKPSPTSGQLQ
jgi:hypothetical protein